MIFFVGMHNKAGMQPLDSRTLSGKIVDMIIDRIGPAQKTNLSDTEHLPDDPYAEAINWHRRHNPKEGDTIILLGKWVQKHFLGSPGLRLRIISAPHPAAPQYRGRLDDYISEIESKISK